MRQTWTVRGPRRSTMSQRWRAADFLLVATRVYSPLLTFYWSSPDVLPVAISAEAPLPLPRSLCGCRPSAAHDVRPLSNLVVFLGGIRACRGECAEQSPVYSATTQRRPKLPVEQFREHSASFKGRSASFREHSASFREHSGTPQMSRERTGSCWYLYCRYKRYKYRQFVANWRQFTAD
jgi:hypothetical protein